MPTDKLSRYERLNLINQFRILRHLSKDKDDSDYYDDSIEILESGYECLYEETFYSNLSPAVTENVTEFVYDVLQMYRSIFDFKKNNASEIDIPESDESIFRGFDGNNETYYRSFALYILRDKELFEESFIENYEYNTHAPRVDLYQEMLNVWNSCEDKFYLSKTDVSNLMTTANNFKYSRNTRSCYRNSNGDVRG